MARKMADPSGPSLEGPDGSAIYSLWKLSAVTGKVRLSPIPPSACEGQSGGQHFGFDQPPSVEDMVRGTVSPRPKPQMPVLDGSGRLDSI